MEKPPLRAAVIVAIALTTLLVMSANRHIESGPPYERETLWLAAIFASSGAIIGLLTLAVVLAPGHWSTRLSYSMIAGSAVAGGWTLFAEWDAFLIWQVILIGLNEAVLVTIVSATVRFRGACLDWPGANAARHQATQITISHLLLLTAASALLASVVGISRPVGYSWPHIAILVAGGASAALAVLTGAWAVASEQPLWRRCAICLLVAPNGGLVYAICDRYMSLLLSARWFALVTTLMLALVIASAAWLRSQGLALLRGGTAPTE